MGMGLPAVAHSQAGAKASVGKLSQEKRGCCWHHGVRQRRKAMCPLSGIASCPSPPACSQPCPPAHTQDHTEPDVHLHLAGGGRGKVQEGCPARRAVWSHLLTDPEPLPALSMPHTWSAVPAHLPSLGVPSTGSPHRGAPGEGRSEGCLAAGEGLQRNYSLHKNIHSSQGP